MQYDKKLIGSLIPKEESSEVQVEKLRPGPLSQSVSLVHSLQ